MGDAPSVSSPQIDVADNRTLPLGDDDNFHWILKSRFDPRLNIGLGLGVLFRLPNHSFIVGHVGGYRRKETSSVPFDSSPECDPSAVLQLAGHGIDVTHRRAMSHIANDEMFISDLRD